MWIWQLAKSQRGSAAAVAARAASSGVSTVIVKAADGPKYWPQFSSSLVGALHTRGVQACAYQFLYGRRPGAEAAVGARAVASGADCLIVDVEGAYAGRYSAAQTYLKRLRASIGDAFPLGFTSLPYVSWHSRIPYSVFLGRGGQVAWLQQHLAVHITARFDGATDRALRTFQLAHGLAPTGMTDGATWQAVLAGAPAPVRWTPRGALLLKSR